MSAATRLRRLDASARITVLERSSYVSYANCGLPYYVGGLIDSEDEVTLQTPESLYRRFRLDVKINHEATDVDTREKLVLYKDLTTGETGELSYDKLIISTGAKPVKPAIPGYHRVHTLRTVEDATNLLKSLGDIPKTAVVIGAGFIGLEITENLVGQGLEVYIVEATNQVLPPLDNEMAVLVQDELEKNGVNVITNRFVKEVTETGVILSDATEIKADLIVGAIGVQPDNELAKRIGLTLGPTGGIAVDKCNLTSNKDIYAVGDVIEKTDAVTAEPSFIALANVANRHGRRVADHICGLPLRYSPSLGTAIVKIFSLTAASVGLNEKKLTANQIPYKTIHIHPYNHATYYPGATVLTMKLLFSPTTKNILGAQIIGEQGVDKRIDVIATAMNGDLTADKLADLELAYAPPFSSAKDPVNMLGYIAENILSGECNVLNAKELESSIKEGWILLDVRTRSEFKRGAIKSAFNIPIDELRERLAELPNGKNIVLYCEVGLRGHTAATLLQELGYTVRNLDGGYRTYVAQQRAANAF